VERGEAVGLGGVDVGFLLQQRPDGLGVLLLDGVNEWGASGCERHRAHQASGGYDVEPAASLHTAVI
jgi:hypothetical protein